MIVWALIIILIITIIIVSLPPPNNIRISHVNKRQLSLTWNSVSQNCPALRYKINATNCGECPDITTSNNVTCIIDNTITQPQTCTITVKSVVCGNVLGIPSEPVSVLLKGGLN